ncbi:MAG: glutamate--tRNA ligase [Frankiaceae bacterium]
MTAAGAPDQLAAVRVRHLTHPPLDASLRCRIAPAPSGDLHVGNVRTALYNWALARRHGGTFVLRVEDTDRSRVSDEAFAAAQDVLRWMGLDWDEGPGVGGLYEPYRQSERLAWYAEAADELERTGAAYRCYCTPAELAQRRDQALREGRPPGYDGRCRSLSEQQRVAFEAEGRTWVLRFRMPPGATTWDDLVRGEITIEHSQIPDFALTRSDGHPLYLLAAAVDDVAMGMTHIIRGEDLVAATPRQLSLYAALGHPQERWPAFGHVPLIVGADNAPLSKRNGEVSIAWYRGHGFLPEAMLNYLSLLGWSPGGDREFFDSGVLVAEFSTDRVSRNPARFDLRKLEALNGDHIRALDEAALARRLAPVLAAAGLSADPVLLRSAVPLVQTRMSRLTDGADLLWFLLVDEADFQIEDHARAKALGDPAGAVLLAVGEAFEALPSWDPASLEDSLWSVGERLGLNKRKVSAPVRVAVTGRTVSPPLFESMVLLGRGRTLARLAVAVPV